MTRLKITKILTRGWIPAFILLLAPLANAQSLGDFVGQGAMAYLATILFYILQVVIKSMSALAGALDVIFSIGITQPDGTSIGVVRTTWTLVRNFSNMFFIIGLIIMAFATIF